MPVRSCSRRWRSASHSWPSTEAARKFFQPPRGNQARMRPPSLSKIGGSSAGQGRPKNRQVGNRRNLLRSSLAQGGDGSMLFQCLRARRAIAPATRAAQSGRARCRRPARAGRRAAPRRVFARNRSCERTPFRLIRPGPHETTLWRRSMPGESRNARRAAIARNSRLPPEVTVRSTAARSVVWPAPARNGSTSSRLRRVAASRMRTILPRCQSRSVCT